MIAVTPSPTTKLAIAIDLDELRGLMREFIDEQKRNYPEQYKTELTFEVFLQWLQRKRQETTNELQSGDKGLRLVTRAD